MSTHCRVITYFWLVVFSLFSAKVMADFDISTSIPPQISLDQIKIQIKQNNWFVVEKLSHEAIFALESSEEQNNQLHVYRYTKSYAAWRSNLNQETATQFIVDFMQCESRLPCAEKLALDVNAILETLRNQKDFITLKGGVFSRQVDTLSFLNSIILSEDKLTYIDFISFVNEKMRDSENPVRIYKQIFKLCAELASDNFKSYCQAQQFIDSDSSVLSNSELADFESELMKSNLSNKDQAIDALKRRYIVNGDLQAADRLTQVQNKDQLSKTSLLAENCTSYFEKLGDKQITFNQLKKLVAKTNPCSDFIKNEKAWKRLKLLVEQASMLQRNSSEIIEFHSELLEETSQNASDPSSISQLSNYYAMLIEETLDQSINKLSIYPDLSKTLAKFRYDINNYKNIRLDKLRAYKVLAAKKSQTNNIFELTQSILLRQLVELEQSHFVKVSRALKSHVTMLGEYVKTESTIDSLEKYSRIRTEWMQMSQLQKSYQNKLEYLRDEIRYLVNHSKNQANRYKILKTQLVELEDSIVDLFKSRQSGLISRLHTKLSYISQANVLVDDVENESSEEGIGISKARQRAKISLLKHGDFVE